jgi:hypothetical protein
MIFIAVGIKSHKSLNKDQHRTKNGHKFNILPANFGQDGQSASITCKIQSGNYNCFVHSVPDCGPAWPKHLGGILNDSP